jgi:D-alanyl-D-alanine endopeptidase (penicillin-binding protein 7)
VSSLPSLIRTDRWLGRALRGIAIGAWLLWLAPLALAQSAAPSAAQAPRLHGRRAHAAVHRAPRRRRLAGERRGRVVHRPLRRRRIVPAVLHRRRLVGHRPHEVRTRRDVRREPIARRLPTPRAMPGLALPVDAQSAYVIDADSGAVLLSKQADVVRPIASLTKLMLASVVLDAHPSMSRIIHITSDDIDRLKWSRSRLEPGMAFSRRELLNLALMSSENRAAHALARHYPGGVAACVAAMNRKARALGMRHTVYLDPTGLNPGNRSTAADLARLVHAAAAYPLIREFTTDRSRRVVARGETLMYRNTDHLITDGWRLVLQKTGFINEAGHCLILDGDLDRHHVVVVLLDDPGDDSDFADAEHIRVWLGRQPQSAFASIRPVVSASGRG